MADELRINASIQYDDGDVADSLDLADLLVTLSTLKFTKVIQSVGTSEEAIPLGEITAPGYILGVNLDDTNYVEVKTGTGGTKFPKLPPGGVCLFHCCSTVIAPFAIANTAACKVVWFIAST